MTADRQVRMWLGVVIAVACIVFGNALHGPRDLVGIGAHLCNVVVLFAICRRVFASWGDAPQTTAPFPSSGHESSALSSMSFASSAALVAAGAYALHPLTSQAVSYGVETLVPISTLLCLLSFYFFLATSNGGLVLSPTGRRARLTVSYLCYGAALLLSPIGVALPVMLLVWDVAPLGTPGDRSRMSRALTSPDLATHAPYVLSAIAAFVLWQVMEEPMFGGQVGTHPDHSLLSHYLTQTTALALYGLRLVYVPIDGNLGIDVPLVRSVLDLSFLLAVLVPVALGALVYRFRHQGALVFWTLWLLVSLLPVTYLVRQGPVVAEYRAYLSLAGFCALVGWTVAKGWQRLPLDMPQLRVGRALGRVSIAIAVVVVFAAFGGQTRLRNQLWPTLVPQPTQSTTTEADEARAVQTEIDTVRWAMQRNPTAGTWVNLAVAYYAAGRYADSIDASYRALALDPNSSTAFNNLCVAFNSLEDWERGIETCTRALELDPDLELARHNLNRARSSLSAR